MPGDHARILDEQIARGAASNRRWLRESGGMPAAFELLARLTGLHNSGDEDSVLVTSFAIYGLLVCMRDYEYGPGKE